MIEVLSDGTVKQNYLPIGRIEFTAAFPAEFTGEWFRGGASADLEDENSALRGEVDDLCREVSDLENEIGEALSDQRAAELTLCDLQDEVRAFLAGNDCSAEAITRLSEALGASE